MTPSPKTDPMSGITAEIARTPSTFPLGSTITTQMEVKTAEAKSNAKSDAAFAQTHRMAPFGSAATVLRSATARMKPFVHEGELPVDVGDTVDHFTLEKELGRGGMGVVFLAHDDSLDRQVALKVIVSKRREDKARERFFREARAQAKLTSPHVVHIHYIGTATRRRSGSSSSSWLSSSSEKNLSVAPATYFAMEYVQGESLEALLDRNEKLDPERGRVLMIEVARGLREAHEAGFIHRDIKPSNLLLDRAGHVKIADFGLAKPLSHTGLGAEPEGSLTGDGVVLGTPMYMPPEQIHGTKVDHRADMYALGASFWNLLAGQPPYDGDSAVAIFAKHLNDPVPLLRSVVPTIPSSLEAIVLRLMHKDPEKRFATYDELIAALDAAAPGLVEPAGFAIRAAASVIDLTIGAALVGFSGPIGAIMYALLLISAQALRGQTLGKYLVRIRAEKLDGGMLGFPRAAARVIIAGWLPVYWATVILLTQGRHGLGEGIRAAAQTDDLRGFLTAFVVQHVFFSLLYAACLGLAAVQKKRAAHDFVVGSRVVHVRASPPRRAADQPSRS